MKPIKAMNYTSMFQAPISMQLKFWYKKKMVVLPWRLSLQGILVFIGSFSFVRFVLAPFLRMIQSATGLILFEFLGTLASSFGLTFLLLNLPLEGKRIDQFIKDYFLFFVKVMVPKKVVYRGRYRPYKQAPVVYLTEEW
ncbi:hypothetical protein IGK80_001126 [Enterococcus sp. DIV0609]|uniref:TcpE family conjugal transfer membrane protein n=1 Tax=unclassified Enterococcus TaxID=2608891 RepID=UPI003F284C31